MHVDVGAGLVGRQRLAVDALELEQVGVARRVADGRQADLDQRGKGRGRLGRARGRSIHGRRRLLAPDIGGIAPSAQPSVRATTRADLSSPPPWAMLAAGMRLQGGDHAKVVGRVLSWASHCRDRRAGAGAAGLRPWIDSETACRRQEGRADHHLFGDQRAGGPAALQDFRGGDRDQVQLHPRQRRLADVADRDRDARQPAFLRHPACFKHPQAAAEPAGAARPERGPAHLSDGARSGPALVRRLHHLSHAVLQHQARAGVRPAQELRGVRQAQGVGGPGRHRPHRHRMAARHAAVLRRAEGHRAGARDRAKTSSRC